MARVRRVRRVRRTSEASMGTIWIIHRPGKRKDPLGVSFLARSADTDNHPWEYPEFQQED